MARKRCSLLLFAAGFILLSFFAVAPKTFAVTFTDHWTLDGTLNDSIGSNNLTGIGSATYVAGFLPSGQAYETNSSTYAYTSNAVPGSDGSFTFSCWEKYISSGGTICGFGNSSLGPSSLDTAIAYYPGTTGVNICWDGSCHAFSSGTDIDDGYPHMITFSYDGTAHLAYVWLDDISLGSYSITLHINSNTALRGGINTDNNLFSHAGFDFQEMWFGTGTSTQADVDTLWSAGIGPVAMPDISTSTPMKQLKADGATQINEGSSTNQSTVVFTAVLESASTTHALQLQVQVATSTFSSLIASSTSAGVTSGNTASTTIAGFLNGSYIWQARVVDSTNFASSSWQRFVASSTVDFVIAMPTSTGYEISDGSVVGLYHLENTDDSSGNLHDLTNTGPVATATALLHNGYNVNGSGQWLTYPSSLGWTSTSQPFSVAFWFKPNVEITSGEMTLFHLDSTVAGDYNYVGYQYNSGSRRLYYGYNGGNQSDYTSLGSSWHHIVYTRDGSGHRDLYVDGLSVASNTTGVTYNTGDDEFSLGATMDNGGNGTTNAIFDEAVVLNRVMTSAEVTALYNGGNGIEICVTVGCNATNLSLSSLNQYMSDATTTIPEDSTTTASTVVFGAKLNSTGTSTLQLQVEVESVTSSFTGVPNATGSFVSPGSEATATFANPAAIDPSVYPRDPEAWSDGSFHWRARVMESGTGVTSTWQTFGPTSTSTDFKIQTVPIYTQEESNYPSNTSTTSWATAAYDDALPGTGCGESTSTITVCGCAISSVSMWLRYYGITADHLGEDVDPYTLNNWLANDDAANGGGYDPGGNLNWDQITHYASSSDGEAILYDSTYSVNGGSSLSVLSSTINMLLGSTTQDPVILVEQHAPDGGATTLHYVVAIATSTYNNTSTYAVRDSYWYNTQYLNQSTSTGPGTVNFYNNVVDGIQIYYDPPTVPIQGEYHVNLPNQLMLVDSQGRRTGEDPATGIVYREIPNTNYGDLGTAGELFTSNVLNGQYTLYVLGATSTYWLDATLTGQRGNIFRGSITPGSMIAYVQNYDTTNIASSTFSVLDTVSSTASITTVPPNNWTPPPFVPISKSPPALPAPLTSQSLSPLIPASSTTPTSTNQTSTNP